MPEARALEPKQAEIELESARENWATKLEDEEAARQREKEVIALGRALRGQLAAKEKALTSASAEAIQATIHARPEAEESRQLVYKLRSEVTFLQKTWDHFTSWDSETAKIAVIECEAASAEAAYLFEQARSAAHDARLFAILAQGSECNGAPVEVRDNGISAGLKRVVADAFDKSRAARRHADEYKREVSDRRAAYEKEQKNG
jgi:hypothetical protein